MEAVMCNTWAQSEWWAFSVQIISAHEYWSRRKSFFLIIILKIVKGLLWKAIMICELLIVFFFVFFYNYYYWGFVFLCCWLWERGLCKMAKLTLFIQDNIIITRIIDSPFCLKATLCDFGNWRPLWWNSACWIACQTFKNM